MMTAINRAMLVALVPAFMLSALGVGLWEGCRGSWRMWRAMWRGADWDENRERRGVVFSAIDEPRWKRPGPRTQQNAGMLDLTPDTLAYGQRSDSP